MDAHRVATSPDDALAGQLVRRIEAWQAPTPRWNDAPARTRLAKMRPSRLRTVVQRVTHRIDLVGWLLGQPNDRVSFNTDPTDPRVLMYNKINATSHRHTGLYASLLRFSLVRT